MTTISIVSTSALGYYGAGAGAIYGTTIYPGVGTVIGGIVGSYLGGRVGGVVGDVANAFLLS